MVRSRSKWFALHALLLAFPACAQADDAALSYVEGVRRFGSIYEGGGVHLFGSLYRTDSALLFAQGRYLRLRNQWTLGSGLGYRARLSDQLLFGVNGFIDYAKSNSGHGYHQATFGVELLSTCFEARLNGYIAGHKQIVTDQVIETGLSLDRTEIVLHSFFSDRIESAYSGFNGEVGTRLGLGGCRSLSAFGGYFAYMAPHQSPLYGPRLRVQAEQERFLGLTGARLFAGVEWQYDPQRKNQTSFFAGVRIPFGVCRCCCDLPCRPRLNGLVVREEGLVIYTQKHATGFTDETIAHLIFVEQGGTGIGTQSDPTNLDDAQNRVVPGDIVFLLADKGPILYSTLTLNSFSMPEVTQLLGFGNGDEVVLTFPFTSDEIVIERQGIGGRGILVGDPGFDVVSAAGINLISGIGITGGQSGLSASNTTLLGIEDVQFASNSLAALHLVNVNGVGVVQSTIQNSAAALILDNPTGDYLIDNLTAVGITDGLLLTGGSAAIALNGTLETTGGHLLLVDGGSNDLLMGGSLLNLAGLGVEIKNRVGGAVAMSSLAILDSLGPAITLSGPGDFALSGSEITGSNGPTFLINGTSGDITFSQVKAEASGQPLFEMGTLAPITGGSIFFHSSTLSQIGGASSIIANSAAEVRLSNTSISATSGPALVLRDNSGPLLFERGLLSSSSAAALTIDGTSGVIDLVGVQITQSNQPLFAMGASSPIVGGSISITGAPLQQIGGPSNVIENCAANVAIELASVAATSGPALVLNGDSGSVLMSLSALSSSSAAALTIDGTSGIIDLVGVQITQSNQPLFAMGASSPIVGGSISITGAPLQQIGGPSNVIESCAANVAIELASVAATSGPALVLNSDSGSVLMSLSALSSSSAAAVMIDATSSDVLFENGSIVQNGFPIALIGTLSGPTGGSIAFLGSTLNQSGGSSNIVQDCAATVDFQNTVLNNLTGPAFELTNNSFAHFTASLGSITNAAGPAVFITGGSAAEITFQGMAISQTGQPLYQINGPTAGNINLGIFGGSLTQSGGGSNVIMNSAANLLVQNATIPIRQLPRELPLGLPYC